MANISSANTREIDGKPLQGSVALVTGGSRGIGKAIARQLATVAPSLKAWAKPKKERTASRISWMPKGRE